MLLHFIRIAIRNLKVNKGYSALTIAGLGVGIGVFFIIFVFIRYQESYDTFHSNKANIYRVLTLGSKPGDPPTAAVPYPMPSALAADFPGWKVTGIFQLADLPVKTLDKNGKIAKALKEKDGAFCVDASFFHIFDFPWLAGDPDKALADRSSVVLSKSTAKRYFGDWHRALGQSIRIPGPKDPFKVTGILADPPSNTDFKLQVVFPYPILNFSGGKDWWSMNDAHECYALLPAGTDTAAANRQLSAFSKKYRTPDNKNMQVLESLAAVHYDDKAGNYSGKTITTTRIRSLWLIAFSILLIACVNFVNIATAQAVNRAKEVGVRKVLGGARTQLRLQFLLETGFLVAGGLLLAVLLISLLIVPIGKVLDVPVSLHLFRETGVLLFLVATGLAVTLLAGFYPAIVLSAFRPITALKARLMARSNRGLTLRRGLVVFQFVVAQALIMGTLVVVRQLDFFLHAPMGYDASAVVTVPFPGDSLSKSKLNYVRDRLMALKGVREVSYNSSAPANDDIWWTSFKFNRDPEPESFHAINLFIDPDYLATYSMHLVAGRNITRTDSIKEFLVNETMVHKLGLSRPEQALNKVIETGRETGPIVGVVRNFQLSSLKDTATTHGAVLMRYDPRGLNAAGIRMDKQDMASTIGSISTIWHEVYPDYMFEYQFLDDRVAGFYKEEARLSLFYKLFSSIAIFLSCLGLYGLASFMAAQRLKEVGIRKVLGATAGHIVYLFSREFVWLVGIAFLVATPIAWYFVNEWLKDYAYRLPIGVWMFVAGGAAALVIALSTVTYQAYRAASTNPVKNLRTE
ncbi:MAG TPA: ABC transporter permease [Puia sp.]|nr:ABC transporter permease [Puia sp.]